MTKSITDIAREAGASSELGWDPKISDDRRIWAFFDEEVEAFVTAIKAAHLAELTRGVEMPEPVGLTVEHGADIERVAASLDYGKSFEIKSGTQLITLDQCQQAVAAAVARHKQEWNRFHHLMKKYGLHPGRTDDDLLEILDKHLGALTAELAKKDAEIAEHVSAHAKYMQQHTAAYNQQVENYRNLQATSIANEEGLRQQLHIANARIRALQKLGVMVEDLEEQMGALTAERDALKTAEAINDQLRDQKTRLDATCAKLEAQRDKANESSAHWQHKYTELTVERDALQRQVVHYRDGWANVCNANQGLINDLAAEQAKVDALRKALEGVMYWDNDKPEWADARAALQPDPHEDFNCPLEELPDGENKT